MVPVSVFIINTTNRPLFWIYLVQNHLLLSACSDPESVRSERHSDRSGLQDEWPSGTEADGGVELLLPHSTAAERGRCRKGHGGEGPGLRSQLSRGGRGHRRYGESPSLLLHPAGALARTERHLFSMKTAILNHQQRQCRST